MHACPGCAVLVPAVMFLCLSCPDATPGELIVTIGAALDVGDEVTAAAGVDDAVGLLNGG